MSASRSSLTAAVQKAILAYVRAGGYPHVAAEAAGVPREHFERWLRAGENPKSAAHYRCFLRALRQAQAQARLAAEVSTRENRPLDWLRSGPGRPTVDSPGWTAPARPAAHATADPQQALDQLLTRLIPLLLEVLAPYPEARTALAAALPAFVQDLAPQQQK